MARNSLEKGIAAAKSGNKLLARLHLLEAAERHPSDVACWLWLAWAAESPDDAVNSLKKALAIEPGHDLALAGLAWARGMAEMTLPAPAAELPAQTSIRVPVTPPLTVPRVPPRTVYPTKTSNAGAPNGPPATATTNGSAGHHAESRTNGSSALIPVPTLAPPPAPVESAPDHRPLVLVVDDSPTVCKLVAITLTRRGYKVAQAADGIDALDAISSTKPSLILMDITMPRLDGYKLCKLIKGHVETKAIPVIMLSGKDGFFDKARGKYAGCDSYITKPFEPDALLREVERYAVMPAGAHA